MMEMSQQSYDLSSSVPESDADDWREVMKIIPKTPEYAEV